MNLGDEVRNKHTDERLTIVDIDYVNVKSHTDVHPVYVLSDGQRWNEAVLYEHFEVNNS